MSKKEFKPREPDEIFKAQMVSLSIWKETSKDGKTMFSGQLAKLIPDAKGKLRPVRNFNLIDLKNINILTSRFLKKYYKVEENVK